MGVRHVFHWPWALNLEKRNNRNNRNNIKIHLLGTDLYHFWWQKVVAKGPCLVGFMEREIYIYICVLLIPGVLQKRRTCRSEPSLPHAAWQKICVLYMYIYIYVTMDRSYIYICIYNIYIYTCVPVLGRVEKLGAQNSDTPSLPGSFRRGDR